MTDGTSTTIMVLGEEVTPLPRTEIYQNLIDHVNGLGPHHWYQEMWDVSFDEEGALHEASVNTKTFQRSESNTCGSAFCLAGEVVAMHGLVGAVRDEEFLNGSSGGWIKTAALLGVPNREFHALNRWGIIDSFKLFDENVDREKALEQLKLCLAEALAEESDQQ